MKPINYRVHQRTRNARRRGARRRRGLSNVRRGDGATLLDRIRRSLRRHARLSLLKIPSTLAVNDLRHLFLVEHWTRMFDFQDRLGREYGDSKGDYTVSAGNVHS